MRTWRGTWNSSARVPAVCLVIVVAALSLSGGNAVAAERDIGAVTEYPIPTANSHPYFIAAGSDRNLWFTEPGVNKVAKVTTSGAITEYPLPSARSLPEDIAAGPDENLWF